MRSCFLSLFRPARFQSVCFQQQNEVLYLNNTKLFALALMLLCITAGVLRFWDIVISFLVAAVLAYLLNPLVELVMRRTGARRGFAVAIALSLVAVVLVFILSMTVPSLIDQVSGLIVDLQAYASNFDDLVYTVTSYLARLHVPENVIQYVGDLLAQSDSYIMSLALSILSSVVGLSLQIFDLIIGVILVVYFMLDGPKLIQSFITFLPPALGSKVAHVFSEANRIAKKYIKSRFIISGCMAAAVFIGLRMFGIKYALVFAIMSFCLDFIPYFGSLIGSIIEIFYALITGGLSLALGVAAYVIIVQQIEGNILAPKIEGNATGIHPLTVLFALLAAQQIFGPLGMLISTPLAAILKIIFMEIYAYIVSDDDAPAPAESSVPEGEQNG